MYALLAAIFVFCLTFYGETWLLSRLMPEETEPWRARVLMVAMVGFAALMGYTIGFQPIITDSP